MKHQRNKKDRDIVKEIRKDDFIKKINKIDDLSWKEAYDIIHDFCYSDIKLHLNEVKQILCFKNKDLIDLFLREYILFDENDKTYVELFINDNLDHKNTAFVSDLLYFATDLSLNINYLKVLNLIKKNAKDENYIVLAAIHYIANNIKYYYVEEIVSSFKIVVNSKDYFQSEQILASISLYRITGKQSFLDFITELIDYDKENLVFLNNLLTEKSYREEYFDLTEIRSKVLK
ncbi:hypothetical protein [Myroides odoratus]|uniref:hypothetical protein n=1 Tax=Myroides odoratus TaxID=256 RepID=UPI003341125A